MKREIKFKAWDKKVNKMSNPFLFSDIRAYDGEVMSIWFETNDDVDVEIGNDLGYGINSAKELVEKFVFLQYTGLKDEKDKEIYEGDIVKKDIICFEVIFIDGCFKLRDKRGNLFDIETELVVIGNIYENPELLKQS